MRTSLICLAAMLSMLSSCGKNVAEVRNPGPQREPHGDNPYENVDIARHMDGIDATFVFLDVQRDIRLVHNPARANTRYTPCSTFKIPNSLVSLETGVMEGADSPIPWDQQKYPKQPFWDDLKTDMGLTWDTDHTLQSAFKNSCVWCYMDIATRIGTPKMQGFVDRFQYGNRDISSGKWPFWLNSSLKISATEQVDFLKRLAQKELKLQERTYQEAIKVFETAKTGASVLYAKTGGGDHIGWYVGFVTTGDESFIFAFNMERTPDGADTFAQQRTAIPMTILTELGVWNPKAK